MAGMPCLIWWCTEYPPQVLVTQCPPSARHSNDPSTPPAPPMSASEAPDTKRPKTLPPPSPSSGTVAPAVQAPLPPASVFAMLRRDVEPITGPRVLLPFFSTMDRLRLSECCHKLLSYQQLLTSIKITQQPTASPGSSVNQLLLKQEPGMLQHLAMEGDSGFLPALEPLRWMWCMGIKSLDLSGLWYSGDWTEVEDVAMTLMTLLDSGALGLVEDLNLKGWLLPDDAMKHFLDTLGAGICPRLRRLAIPTSTTSEILSEEGTAPRFHAMVDSGVMPDLEVVDIDFSAGMSHHSAYQTIHTLHSSPAAARLIHALDFINGLDVDLAADVCSGVFVHLEELKAAGTSYGNLGQKWRWLWSWEPCQLSDPCTLPA